MKPRFSAREFREGLKSWKPSREEYGVFVNCVKSVKLSALELN